EEFGYEVEKVSLAAEEVFAREEDDEASLHPRPPVVTVMGHVDHGKTKLLDAIRETNVTDKEAGGITQHIGAYLVDLPQGEIVFIDTPGHEAFTAMRARGSQVTDIVVLVVAANEGVKEQTTEAINHARDARVPIIVAINKIDLPEANPEKIRRELAEQGLLSEEWGGDTIFVEISAKQKTNIDKLLEMILLQAEILELKANPNKLARGVIIESRLDKGQGPVATVLIQEGTLKVGDPFVSGQIYGKVRAMFNDKGKPIEKAGPAFPVEVLGFAGTPNAGDSFIVVSEERKARMVAEHRQQKERQQEWAKVHKVTLENLYDKIKEEELKELKLIIKADVHGSIEALTKALMGINTNERIKLNLIHSAVGAVNESDVMLASASNAIIIGFNVAPDQKSQNLASVEHVDIRTYNIIYDVIDDIKKAMEGLLAPIRKEMILGRAEVIQLFHVSKVGTIAGSKIVEGKMVRGASARLLRNDEVIHEGKISTLKRLKDDVKEALTGYECGIKLDGFNDIQLNDTVEAYTYEEVASRLE
ncbi:MAG: translation initiation factor IF-2, partial [Candidatus Zixiibacteriota bacterium]